VTTRARKGKRRLPNAGVGLLAVVLIVVGLFLAFSKRIPFTDRGYELTAVVRDAQNLAEKSPVRIAGVNVGEVIKVEPVPESNVAEITMVISDDGRPIHEDARIQLRPRLFLEGNLFIDVRPGSPSAKELPDGGTIPIEQTSNSVQVDQILTTLQADVRGNLQLLLKELGNGLTKYGGAEGLRELYRTGGPAYKNTALVNEALLGTREGDLSGLIKNFDRVFVALNRNQPQLQDLVTNLRTVTGSFAAESDALESAVAELPGVLDAARPVFDNLNASFPPLRAFAREALPGVQSTSPTIDVSLPFIRQLRALVSPRELRGLTADLRPTIPHLAKLARRQIPFNEQARALSSCFTNVIIPWSNDRVGNGRRDAVGDPISEVYKETGYGLVGIAGESRSGDANGQYIRVGAGGGATTIIGPNVPGIGNTFGVVPFPIEGSEPDIDSSRKTHFKPKVPCETQEPPDLRSEVGPAPQQSRGAGITLLDTPLANTELGDITREYLDIYTRLSEAQAEEIPASDREAQADYVDLLTEFQEFNEEQLPRYRKLIAGGGS
jgi:phospholipid/cholesterol/gamma-HCH transport system substrate-binding protein